MVVGQRPAVRAPVPPALGVVLAHDPEDARVKVRCRREDMSFHAVPVITQRIASKVGGTPPGFPNKQVTRRGVPKSRTREDRCGELAGGDPRIDDADTTYRVHFAV